MALCLGLSWQSLAQTGQFTKFLVVDRLHGPKRYRYVPHKLIHLKSKDGERFFGPISRVLDSAIIVENDTVALKEIQVIYLEDKAQAAKLVSDVLITAGVGYFAISTFNRTINDDAPIIHPSTYNFGVPALGIGFLIKLLVKPKVKIKDPRQLKILDLSIE